jgi:hypothetical protein
MGLEMKAHGGRLVHVRETGRVDEMREDRPTSNRDTEPAAPAWVQMIAWGVIAVLTALAVLHG